MKFTWGTGIFVFLALFLIACAVFIIFASRQHVNLVYKDYYEKGVDYSEQMRVNGRSKLYSRSINISSTNEYLLVNIEETLAAKIDSGNVLMYRPSDSAKDIQVRVEAGQKNIQFRKHDLLNGRYILKFTWFMEGIKYEVDRPVNVQ
jgi:hypothetical protein